MSGANQAIRAVEIAAQITSKAEGALAGLEQEMTLMKWPAQFRAIMWDAVADIATRRANEARDG